MHEIYLVARGESVAVVAGGSVRWVRATCSLWSRVSAYFTDSSEDYLRFVIQTPFVKGDKVDLGGGSGVEPPAAR